MRVVIHNGDIWWYRAYVTFSKHSNTGTNAMSTHKFQEMRETIVNEIKSRPGFRSKGLKHKKAILGQKGATRQTLE